ncbi:GDSL-type esterase/lipase family protein [Hymenobacter sp. HD11105]
MPVGDSITHGDTILDSYRRPLWKKLLASIALAEMDSVDFVGGQESNYDGPPPNPDFDKQHHGHGGWNTTMLLPEVRQWSIDHQPDIILLHAGTNDLVDRKSIESTRDNLGKIIDEVRKANPAMKVLLAQLIPSNISREVNDDITALNALLPALANQKSTTESPVVVVDQNTGFSLEEGVDLYDALHPNARGEEKMAERWYEALRLKSILGKPLPVSLVEFSAQAVPAGVRVQWTTASEQNNAGFTLERSLSGTEFEAVGRVAGQGTTLRRHSYSFLDVAPPQPIVYYRLRQTDTDGANTFSQIVVVSNTGPAALEVSPVPAENVLKVSGVSLNTEVTIWNMRGQLVYRQPAQSSQVVIDVSRLASGVYQLRAGTQRTRFMKQ